MVTDPNRFQSISDGASDGGASGGGGDDDGGGGDKGGGGGMLIQELVTRCRRCMCV